MNFFRKCLGVLAGILFLTSFYALAGESQVNQVDPSAAVALIKANTYNDKFIILDVRTPEEFLAGHIENAINIDVSSGDFESKISELDKNGTYLIYCRSGRRSMNAANKMKELGFLNLSNLLGGIIAWTNAGYPVTK